VTTGPSGRTNLPLTIRRVVVDPLEPGDVTLPKRRVNAEYVAPDLPLKHIPTPF
jgi:hypothetical protein